jgi:integrase
MSFKTLMTWEPAKSRWRKMYRGKIYTVSCESLGVPSKKEASYRAANDWWGRMRAGLDAGPPSRHPSIKAELERRRDWAGQNDPELADVVDNRLQQLEDASDDEAVELALTPDLDERIATLKELGIKIPDSISRLVLEGILGDQRLFRARHDRTLKVPQDRTVGAQVKRYLDGKMVEARANQISVSEYDLIRINVGAFRDWIGSETAIDDIGTDRWKSWWHHVLESDGAIESKKKRYRYARSFVWALVEDGLITAPSNLGSRKIGRFKGGVRAVPTMTVDEVRSVIEAAPGQLKLHLLLMANCGMTQIDISDLRLDQVDWMAGRIIRKRSKTDDHENVPTVNHKLWPLTITLLKEYRQPSGERALMTVSGRPWVRDYFKPDGKRSKVDSIKSNYVHIQKRLRIDKPMKLLRKTSATLIEQQFSTLFLGHSPRTIKDKHYTAPDQEGFDAAVLKLGQLYGYA